MLVRACSSLPMKEARSSCIAVASLSKYILKMMKFSTLIIALLLGATTALAPLRPLSRHDFMSASSAAVAVAIAGGSPTAFAAEEKLTNLSNEKIAEMIKADVVEGQFLANGRLTR